MLQKLREWLVLALIAVLPFHAFLVTVGTLLLVGPGHAPLLWLVGWKEVVLVVVIFVTVIEILREFKIQNSKFKIDMLDWLILGLFALSVLVPILNSPAFADATAGRQFLILHSLYGFKYTLFPLLLFPILRRVQWSERFTLLVTRYSLLVGAVVAMYGILTLFLPESFFTWLGYSDLHSLYLPDGPLAAFQYLEGTVIRRMQSTFAGPNQLGMWLLIPWSIALSGLLRFPSPVGGGLGRGGTMCRREGGYVLLLLLFAFALFLTFSRAAWIGAAAIMGVLLATRYSLLARWKFWSVWVIGLLVVCVVGGLLFPAFFLRTASSREHWRRPMEAIRVIAAHPFGLGLGSVGPAANRTGDSCVYLEEGADPSWAKDRPNLCVFVGNQQVQPFDSAQGKPIPCRCPFLPENWYLQVGVELGIIGLVLYLLLVGVTGYSLLVTRYSFDRNVVSCFVSRVSCLAFLGISVAALFLHAWEDSAVAYTVWILVAMALSLRLPSPGGRGLG